MTSKVTKKLVQQPQHVQINIFKTNLQGVCTTVITPNHFRNCMQSSSFTFQHTYCHI